MWAVKKSHEAVVKLLLETSKVDIDSEDDLGETPLSLAQLHGHAAIVDLISQARPFPPH